MDALLLSRLQFAFVIAYHILFPAFTIGLASYLAVLEGLWLVTGRERFRTLYRFWLRIFAVSFGMGVVSGIVMSFQFGTNWARLSTAAGPILGPLLSYEVLTAFFLEAGFLGIMLFGWNKVGKGLHYFATCMVALGTLLSTFWIISANSWMQTPDGFALIDGKFVPVDWWRIVFNPSFPYRLAHMVLAAYLTTGMAVAGCAAWLLLKRRAIEESRTMLLMAVGLAAVLAPLQMVAGDASGLAVGRFQPAKLAALEARWETAKRVPLTLFGLPNAETERTDYAIEVPVLGSIILTHDPDGEVKGLKDFPRSERPPVWIVFWSFRIMVAMGLLMLAVGLVGGALALAGRLGTSRWFHRLCLVAAPSGFIAVVMGWVTAEVGRQPYVIYGQMRTADAVTPFLPAGSVLTTLLLFIVSYAIVFTAGAYYMFRLLQRGPEAPPDGADHPAKTARRPLSMPEGAPS
ncbi:cytochrome ubiquinol oxidase subunit I [Roseiterribacter gracilis]|uniref:Cytochrome ubiquinol oxidase subunit I n=1 Tax=Roseiterribacter gracilis TaxID=2812848 RepID=A0A8S8XBA4_9PROT|nr:cytochrome ubiquinol oxidase subunit I [Rhodospirillales bacterium TMPK1]